MQIVDSSSIVNSFKTASDNLLLGKKRKHFTCVPGAIYYVYIKKAGASDLKSTRFGMVM